MRGVRRSGEGFVVHVASDASEAAALDELASVVLIVTGGSEPGIGGPDGLRNRLASEAWVLRVGREEEPRGSSCVCAAWDARPPPANPENKDIPSLFSRSPLSIFVLAVIEAAAI